jgi:acyl carrier protein
MSDTVETRLDRVLKSVKSEAAFSVNANVRTDLGLDSLDVMMLLFEVEKEFGVKISEEDLSGKNLLVLGRLAEYLTAAG